MEMAENQKTEEEIADLLADALTGRGLSASSQDTSGSIWCVILQRKGGGEIIWGTADFNWGACITNQNGEPISSIATNSSSECQDVSVIVDAIAGASIEAGAAFRSS